MTAAPRVPAGAVAGVWGAAEEVPGLAALNFGDAQITSVSCPSAGDCGAGGFYTDNSFDRQAFVVSEVNGVWGAAEEVTGLPVSDIAGLEAITSMSCPSAGNCGAGGWYAVGASSREAFVVSEVNGVWGAAQEVPGIEVLNTGAFAAVQSVSCASAGNCDAGGFYTDSSINSFQHAFVVSEVNGAWGAAEDVPGTAGNNLLAQAGITSMSCSSAGSCSAGGAGGATNAFVVSEVNGAWGAAEAVPGTGLYGGADMVTSVSCASAGNCTAGGQYVDAAYKAQAFVAKEANGAWGKVQEVPGIAALNTGGEAQVTSVSCPSEGNCSAGGYYLDGSPGSYENRQAFVASEANGAWGAAEEVPGTAALNTYGDARVTSMSCASAGNCSAGGYYYGYSPGISQQAFVVDEVDGAWGAAEEVPGTAALNAGGSAEVDSVSCASAGNCGAGGYYEDGSPSQQAFVVSERPLQSSATALNLSASTVTYGYEQAETVSAMVSAPGTPTGTVTVKAASTTLCTIALKAGAGSCTLPARKLPAGAYQVTGAYSGDANADPSVSPAKALTVDRPHAITQPSVNYAGYSERPQQGTVSSVSAQWTVPKVDCRARRHLTYKAALSVWVGLWGRKNDPSVDWLPQVGTYSQCAEAAGQQVEIYKAVYEIYHKHAHTKVLMDVQAGDKIRAQVRYLGRSAGKLEFSFSLKDVSQNTGGQGRLYTAKGVSLADAAYQGGAIVERAEAPTKWSPFNIFPVNGGLPKFKPITISHLTVGRPKSGRWKSVRWVMQRKTHSLAGTGALSLKNGSFAVTWRRWS